MHNEQKEHLLGKLSNIKLNNEDVHSSEKFHNKSQKFYLDYAYKYTNIGHAFAGIGYVLVDIDGIIKEIIEKHKLIIDMKPTLFVLEYFEFLNNFLHHAFQDVRYFSVSEKVEKEDKTKYLREAICNTFKIALYSGINKEERVALIITSFVQKELFLFLMENGFYTTCVDSFVYQDTYVYGHIFTPEKKFHGEKYKNNAIFEATAKIFEEENNLFKNEICQRYNIKVKENERIVYEEIKIKAEPVRLIESVELVDGYLENNFYKVISNAENSDKIFKTKNNIDSTQNGLDLCMPPIPEKISMKHMQNITKSAKSLCDGNFMFSDALMFAVEENTTTTTLSKKSQSIIDQNKKKKEAEKSKADSLWLNNFFNNYSKLKTHVEKRRFVEDLKINNDFINRKLLLLKIELYNQIWSIETKGEVPDESKLVPLYLACLEYMEKYVLRESTEEKTKGKKAKKEKEEINPDFMYNKEEMDFVVEIFSGAGFGCTANEILLKNKLIDGKLIEEGAVKHKVSDVDLYFQLKYCGQFLKRSLGTKKDKRVPFEPDAWQVDLLDAVDAEKSVVISAPTSSGKTFICYYVVEKLLKNHKKQSRKDKTEKRERKGKNAEEDYKFSNVITNSTEYNTFMENLNLNNSEQCKSTIKQNKLDVVVFCLPTKALANQVSADVYARFKPLKNVNLQGTLMNDRCSEPYNSQVLITIPSMLELVLYNEVLSVKNLVIDEVHKINDVTLSKQLERVIHMAQCPILLLSATIGNLNEFYSWFKKVEEFKGRETELVTHKERFCELRHFAYSFNSDNFKDKDLKDNTLIKLNCMFAYTQQHLKDFGFGDDLQFLPEELLNIFYYIFMVLDEDKKKLIKKLAPRKFFTSNIISKSDVKQYEKHLLDTFQTWVQEEILSSEQVEEVYKMLTGEAHERFNEEEKKERKEDDMNQIDVLTNNIYSVCTELQGNGLLPAIFFNTDREICDKLLRKLTKKMSEYDEIVEAKKDKSSKVDKTVIKKKEQWIEDSIQNEQKIQEGKIRHTFCGAENKLSEYEVKQELNDAPAYLVEAALRGVGIHHNGVSRKVKSAMEILFRKKHIKVLIATETLALGINMPCRTTVFYGDSVELDPMNYKQMAGRAGRRGYDTLGNVIYCGMTKSRIQNLMVSMLPKLTGGNVCTNGTFGLFSENGVLVRNCLENITLGNFSKISEGNGLVEQSEELKSFSSKSSLVNNNNNKKSKTLTNLAKYPFIYENNYLRDLFVVNREHEPSIFIFGYLLDQGLISYAEKDFMLLVSHLFEVIPAIDSEIYLEDLDEKLVHEIEKLSLASDNFNKGNLTANSVRTHSSNSIYLLNCKKNSYIYDFYMHGSKGRIQNINKIGSGELWRRLQSIQQLIDSTVELVERYFTKEDERYKKLRVIQKNFEEKYKGIFA